MGKPKWDDRQKQIHKSIDTNAHYRPSHDLQNYDAKTSAQTVFPDNYADMDFTAIYWHMDAVAHDVAPSYRATLTYAGQTIYNEFQKLKETLKNLDELEQGWKGKTHDAAMALMTASYDFLEEAVRAAAALGVLSQYFSDVMNVNKNNLLSQLQNYKDDVAHWPKDLDHVNQIYNEFARDVMTNYYWPEIADIAKNQPTVTSAAKPPDPKAPEGGGKQGGGGGGGKHDGGGGGGGGGGSKNGGGGGGGGGKHGDGGGDGDGGGGGGGKHDGGGGGGGGLKNGGDDRSWSNGGGGSKNGGGGGSKNEGGGGPSGGGDKPPSYSPPDMSNIKQPGGGSGGGSGSGSGSPNGGGGPGGGGPSLPGNGGRSTFDPSKALTDPRSLTAARNLLNDPKTADAARKLLSDPKLADAARTLFGDGRQSLLGNPKALDAARTLFGDPAAADAAKKLFGDPETAKAAQQLLNDPHLGELGKALQQSGLSNSPVPPDANSDVLKELSRNLAGQSGSGGPGLGAGYPSAGLSGGSSDSGQSLIGSVLDGINQIVQTAQQSAAPQPPDLGVPGVDGHPEGVPSATGGGGHGGGAGAAPGQVHLSPAGVPIAAANHTLATHAGALNPVTDGSATGAAGGGGMPPGGGHGGGGQGGDGKDHKGSKALRGLANGEYVLGEPDAVVSVIGDDASDDDPWRADQ